MKHLLLSFLLATASILSAQFTADPDQMILGVDSINDQTQSTFFYVDMYKKAMRLGEFVGGQHPHSSLVGSYSSIRGQVSTASGSFSTAYGLANHVSKNYGLAIGSFNMVNGVAGVAIGQDNQSSGDFSFSLGLLNTAKDSFAIAMGYKNNVESSYATTWGKSNIVVSRGSTAWGESNQIKGPLSTGHGANNQVLGAVNSVWGGSNLSKGDFCTVWGTFNEADSTFATAWGVFNEAKAESATVWGQNNQSIARLSSSWGNSNVAKGEYSTSFGHQNLAQGQNSTAIGRYNRAYYQNSLVVGQYNDAPAAFFDDGPKDDDQLFVIGNGDNNSNRSNAMTVLKNGNVGIGVTDPQNPIHLPAFSQIQLGDVAAIYGHDNVVYSNSSFYPTTNAQNIGGPSNPWNAIYATNGTIQTSDIRLKENISDAEYGISTVMQMKPLAYNLISSPDQRDLGFSAQALESLVPEAVYKSQLTNKEGESSETYGVDYSELIPVLTKAIQEQQSMIEALQKEIAELKVK